jgi:hypothetical protein
MIFLHAIFMAHTVKPYKGNTGILPIHETGRTKKVIITDWNTKI